MAVRNTRSTHPSRSPQVEHMLKSRGLDFEFEANLAIADIRHAEGFQVRLDEHQAPKDQVAKYATAMKHGATFPAIVVNENHEKIDGNTRLAARQKNGDETIAAYIVFNISELEARSLSVELNQSNGLAMTEVEIRNFIEAAIKAGQHPEVRALARMTGIRDLKISRWIAEVQFDERAIEAGISARHLAVLPPSTRASLNAVRMAAVFGALTLLAAEARIPAAEVKRLVTQVNGASSEEEAIEIVTNERENRADDIRSVASGFAPRELRSRGSAQHIGGLLRFDVESLLDVSSDKQPETYARLKELRDRLDQVVMRAATEWNLEP
ncbi:MAG TPA: hypothetical protein VG228_01820, partial [Solirubrobacteraceae bacterium]|nr:hypothetical protein [Solirubrobacteraceae bacterium]